MKEIEIPETQIPIPTGWTGKYFEYNNYIIAFRYIDGEPSYINIYRLCKGIYVIAHQDLHPKPIEHYQNLIDTEKTMLEQGAAEAVLEKVLEEKQ